MYYKGNSVYEGEWEGDKKQGKGVFKYADGKVYEGKFVNDVACG